MKQIYKKFILSAFSISALLVQASAEDQVTLNADGPGNTYELINSVLAPGYNAIETPDLIHADFGRHITEVFDADLNKSVFEFSAHLSPDNEPNNTTLTDRQRVEIKTYNQSPANLIGVVGETVTYSWRYKIANGFLPSSRFTHLHQIKPVDGDDGDPLFSITARKGNPNKIELNYVPSTGSSTTKLATSNLSNFEGEWVESTETILIGANGKYAHNIKRLSDGAVLLAYTNNNLMTIRPGNSFIRPKWGIYRSIVEANDMRDETVRFSDFSINEGETPYAGTTYFWVGGLDATAIGTSSNWNTQLNGGGSGREASAADDILIFDGNNFGGGSSITGTAKVLITGQSFGQLILQNGAQVEFTREGGGTGTMTVNGDGSDAPDLVLYEGCKLSIVSSLDEGNVNIALLSPATGIVYSGASIRLFNTGTHRITSQVTNGLVFTSGSSFYSESTPTSGAYPFGSSSQSVQYGTMFEKGANLFVSGTRSPLGNSSTFQAVNLSPGSNYYQKASNATGTGSWTNLKIFGNIFVQENSTFKADGPFYKIDTLNIASGSSLIVHTSGNTAVLGDLIVDGSLTAPDGSSNVVIVGGSVPQTISGAGTINLTNFTIANYSDVTLEKAVSVANTGNMVGKLTLKENAAINGVGNFTSRVDQTPVTFTGNTTAGSYMVTNVTSPSGISGLYIKGNGLAANTNVVGFSSSNSVINLSKPATSTTTGTEFTFASDTATIVSQNTMGVGAISVGGNKSFQSGTNYIVETATVNPIGINSDPGSSMNVGNLTLKAPATTNYNVTVSALLTLNNTGVLSIRSTDTVRINAAKVIGGMPFSTSNYIATLKEGSQVGVLRVDDAAAHTSLPVGTSANYLPIALTPATTSDFAVSIFEGATKDGSVAGTAFSADEKKTFVDAVWNIDRINGSGDCDVMLSWVPGLEGSTFSTVSNNLIGVAKYSDGNWNILTANGDNATNVATGTFSTFSPFSVGQIGGSLPLKLVDFSAKIIPTGVNLQWNVLYENAGTNYTVERSDDGYKFTPVTTVKGNNSGSYSILDANNPSMKSYYRIKLIEPNAQPAYSFVVVVNKQATIALSVYPNPAVNTVIISGIASESVISLIQSNGQVVKQYKAAAGTLGFNVANVMPGVYTLKIVDDKGNVTTKKIVKQ